MADKSSSRPKFKRIILKLSGEALAGDHGDPIGSAILADLASQIKDIRRLGVQTGIVIGGGNIFRGLSGEKNGVDRTTGDYMGMLATVINGLALQNALEKTGVPTRVMTAIEMKNVAEPFIRRRAVRHLEKGIVVIFVAGTGNPYFSTDTTAALRASEMNAQIIMKATKVDGVYDSDPMKNKNAKKYQTVTFSEALQRRLKVMDSTAFSLCMDNHMPILVFDLFKKDNIKNAVLGKKVGTLISN
ncbi:UMP kinase [Oscillatoria laete-virens NRMC-F 0139]|nr:UMP kinase [Oscillatoria laete-virens]MDL5053695.1 UMP kinase [Oscillatoria laete-virens NRMC-F 0139]